MTRASLNYDRFASNYDQRYAARSYPGILAALSQLVRETRAENVLEVGCGTGHWLREIKRLGFSARGLDPSLAMLKQARDHRESGEVLCGVAEALPLSAGAFDLVFCVNAFHHFREPETFLSEAARVLKPRGRLAVIGLDPHQPGTRWYLYESFPGVRDRDLARYRPHRRLAEMLRAAGFQSVSASEVEPLSHRFVGGEVWSDPFLEKDSTSQLMWLSDAGYAAGLSRIREAIVRAGAAGLQAEFAVHLSIFMVTGALLS